jgi:hypothetical protein
MIEVLPREPIDATEKGPPHAAADAVIDADFGGIEEKLSGNAWHGEGPTRAQKVTETGEIGGCKPLRVNVILCTLSVFACQSTNSTIMGGPQRQ